MYPKFSGSHTWNVKYTCIYCSVRSSSMIQVVSLTLLPHPSAIFQNLTMIYPMIKLTSMSNELTHFQIIRYLITKTRIQNMSWIWFLPGRWDNLPEQYSPQVQVWEGFIWKMHVMAKTHDSNNIWVVKMICRLDVGDESKRSESGSVPESLNYYNKIRILFYN